jgi:hypothetical protein
MSAIQRFAIGTQLTPVIAAFNGGGNDGFWRFQWRDRTGRWVKMGRSLKFKLRMPDGSIRSIIGKFSGGSKDGKFARVFVSGERDIPSGYYHVSSKNGAEVIAHLDSKMLAERGIVPGKNAAGKNLSSRDAKDVQDYDSIGYEPPSKDQQNPKDEDLQQPDEQAPDTNAIDNIDSYTDGEPNVSSNFDTSLYSSFKNDSTKDLTEEQHDALMWFSDTGYDDVSSYFRKGETLDAEDQAMTDEIIKLIGDSKVTNDALVYRGMAITEKKQFDEIFGLKAGDELLDLGVGSHSTDIDRAAFYAGMLDDKDVEGRALFRVVVPKDSNALRIPDSASSYGSSEKEVILPPNSKFKVNAVHNMDGTRVIDVELLPQGESKPKETKVPASQDQLDELANQFDKATPEQQSQIQKALGRGDMSSDDAAALLRELIFKPEPKKESKDFTASDTQVDIPFRTTEWVPDGQKPKNPNATLVKKGNGGAIYESEGHSRLIDYGGRKTVLMDIDGVKVPFYLSTGAGGKKNVPAGKWYPAMGIGDDGWINKSSAGMVDYYGSEKLRKQAEWLDNTFGDIRTNSGVPKVADSGSHIQALNEDMGKPISLNDGRDALDKNIADIVSRVEGAGKPASAPTSTPKPSAIPKPTPIAPLPKAQTTEKQKNDDDLKSLQINEPVFNVFNNYEPDLENNDTGIIEIPDSPEAQALSKLGRDATPEELAKLKADSLALFSTDPNYKPKEKAKAEDLVSLTKMGGSAFTYVDSSLDINKRLRDQVSGAENMQQVTDLDSAMLLSSHLAPGMTVYRMLKLSTWKRLNPQVGKVMVDRAFMSTSHTKEFSNEAKEIDGMSESINQVPMRIVMPTNTAGLDLSSISWYDKEDEYLLPRKTALRFLGWDSNGYAVFERVN